MSFVERGGNCWRGCPSSADEPIVAEKKKRERTYESRK